MSFSMNTIDKSKWVPVRFDKIAKNISERVEPGDTDLEIYIGLEHIDAETIHIKRFGKPSDVEGQKLKCYPGDVIFGKRRAYQRKAAIVEQEAICSAHAFVLRANPEVIDPKLFPFFLHSDQFMHRAVDISVGGLSPTINWKNLKEQEFLLPPNEQQAELAELFWAMDEVIEKDLTLQESLSANKSIVLSDLISNGIEKETGFTLGQIGKWTSGGTPSKGNQDFWSSRDYMWVTPKDMKSFEIADSMDWVSESVVSIGKAKIFPRNSVALVWRSGILQHTLPISKVMSEFTVNQDLKVLENVQNGFLQEYIRIFLQVNCEKIRRACVKEGTTVQSIDTTSFQKFPIKKLAEQTQLQIIEIELSFAISLQKIESKISAFKTLQKSLINEVF